MGVDRLAQPLSPGLQDTRAATFSVSVLIMRRRCSKRISRRLANALSPRLRAFLLQQASPVQDDRKWRGIRIYRLVKEETLTVCGHTVRLPHRIEGQRCFEERVRY